MRVDFSANHVTGQAMSIEVTEVLHEEKTEFQDLVVFQSKTYGRVLVLDGNAFLFPFSISSLPWSPFGSSLPKRKSYN